MKSAYAIFEERETPLLKVSNYEHFSHIEIMSMEGREGKRKKK